MGKLECLAVALDQHCMSQKDLLVALQSVSQGFRVGLGSGLDAWARAQMIPRGEWGGIRVTQEAASEEDEESE